MFIGDRIGIRTDFYEQRKKVCPLRQEPIVCPTCGFAGLCYWWDTMVETLGTEEEAWRRPKLQFGPTDPTKMPLDERFERCAKSLELVEATEFVIADVWLRASWAAFEQDDPEAERYYQLRAVTNFAIALKEDQVDEGDISRVMYLVGELNRRSGRDREAKVWFDYVLQGQGANAGLLRLTKQQLERPEEWLR